MSATILLKRTRGTSPPNAAPIGTGVSFGELVYAYDTSDVGAGKSYKKLYIGNPDGPTAAPIPIAGEYYTSLFSDSPSDFGTPLASKVVVLNADARVNSWYVIDDFYVSGIGTVAGDFNVGGNLNVTGDLVYDEANARNWNITGVATAATLEATNFTFTNGVIEDLFAVTGVVTTLSGTSADYYEVNVGHALTTNNLEVTGVGSFSNQVTFANDIIKIGRDTAVGLSSADSSIFIGDFVASGMGQTTLNRRNIAIGASAMQYAGILSSSDELESNIVMGNFAGYRLQGTKNLMIGDKVGFALSSSGNDENIALGNQAMYGETFPVVDGVSLSVNIGDQTALANYDETEDVTETSGSGTGLLVRIQTGATGLVTNIEIVAPGDGYEVGDTFTMPFGFQTLTGSVTSKNGRFLSGGTGTRQQKQNIAIGPYTLYNVDGSKNIAIGYSAGANTLGDGNVIIGYNQDPALLAGNNQLIVGTDGVKWISGNSDGWVGIGTTAPDALLAVNGDLTVSGVATIPQIDINDIGVEDIKVTAGLATDFAITNAKIQSGIITDTVGTAATITRVDFIDADIEDAKITVGLATDFAVTNLRSQVAIVTNAYIDVGVVTSLTGTAATITTFDANEGDINTIAVVSGVVTSISGFGVTYNTADFNILDSVDAKITTGLITSLTGTYVTYQDAKIDRDVLVGGAVTIGGNLTVEGTTTYIQSTVVEVQDKNIELGVVTTGSPSDAGANNGGIILKGTTDKTFTYDFPREAWEANLKFIPSSDDSLDIGTTDREWRDIYIDGTAHLDSADILDAKITAGIITSQVGTYATITTVDIETLDAKDVNITGLAVTDIVGTAATITTLDINDADLLTAKVNAGLATDFAITNLRSQVAIATNAYIDVGVVTSLTGTAATITTIDATEGDIVNAKITAGVVTSLVGTYATITTFDTETLDAKDVNITGLAVTDIVGTAATITTIDISDADLLTAKINAGLATDFAITNLRSQVAIATNAYIDVGVVTSLTGTAATITTIDVVNADIEDAKITAGLATDFAITNLVSQVGIATSAFITSGFVTSLYDSTGVVGLNTQHILSTDPAGTITWREPAQIGVATINPAQDTWYVATHGVDDNEPSRGRTQERPYRTVAYALSQVSSVGVNDILLIGAGVYEETFPLIVPAGLTVKGAGLRATKIKPTTATRQKDGFLLNDRCVVEDLTVADQYFDTAGNQGWAFKYAPGIAITTRSPYIQRVTVFNKGSNITSGDPYGYGSADSPPSSFIAGGGAYVDGSEVASGSLEAAFLFNECTFIVPNSKGLEFTNGARVEYLNCFTYFASEGIKGVSGTAGLSSTGETTLRLTGLTTTVSIGNTITYFDTDGVTGLATAIVSDYDGTYIDVTGKQTGFEVLIARTAKAITFNGNAQLATDVKKFGSASLELDGSNDSISIPSSGDLGFGTDTDFTVEFFVNSYQSGLSSATLVDFRDDGTDAEGISLAFRAAGEIDMRVGTSTAIEGSGAGISTGTWYHVALAREGTDTRLFVDGSQIGIKTSDTTDYGSSKGLVIGADFDGTSNSLAGYIDEVRVEHGVAKYTGAFTAPTEALLGDNDTSLLLHFDGSAGVSTTTDDVIRNQDIRITQPGGGIGTATKIILADYSDFGADMRSVGCAIEYGQKGVIADGDGVTLRLFALNFNNVGAGGNFSNDPNLAIQANEVTETNNGDVSFVSIDHKGDFRVGDAFYVDQESGTVSFSQQVTSLQALSSLTITDGTDSSTVTPTSGTFGNIQISGNNIESTTGDINIDPAGAGDINITGDVNVLGILTATTIQLDSFQKGDTSIALDDSGSDGTIRFNTDGVEGMRLDASQKLGVGTASPRDRLDVLDTARFERVNVTGVATFSDIVDVNNIDIVDAKIVAGLATDLAVTNLRSQVAIATNAYIDVGVVTSLTGTAATITTIDADNGDIFDAKITGVAITNAVFTGITSFKDGVKANFGDDNDLQIYHDGSNSYIDDAGTGTLAIRSNQVELQKYTGETLANFTADGANTLFYDNSKKFETTSIGASVTGKLQTGTLEVSTDAEIHASLVVDQGTVLTGILTSSAGIEAININISGILTTNNFRVTGVSTIADITIGAGSSSTKINTNTGELVLDSAAGQVTIQDDLSVIGYGTFRDGIYYRSDQGGITGLGYSGPNGVAYFENDGRLVSGLSTVGFLTTSNYVLTTDENNIPIWSDSIDGGTF